MAFKFKAGNPKHVRRMCRIVREAVEAGSPVHITMTVEGGADEDTIAASRELVRKIEEVQRSLGHEVEVSITIKGGLA